MWLLLLLLTTSDGPFFQGSLGEATTRASQEDKHILIDFYTDWCGPCKLMTRTTFADQDVQKVLQTDVIALKVNAEVGQGVMDAGRYQVRAYPTLIILNAKGDVVKRQVGYVSAKDLLTLLEPFRKKNP